VGENEVKEFAANGTRQSLPGNGVAADFSESIIKSNGHLAANGR
jgi:hypothetical protein